MGNSWETVRNSGRLSESRQHCERSGDVIKEAVTSSHHHDDDVAATLMILPL